MNAQSPELPFEDSNITAEAAAVEGEALVEQTVAFVTHVTDPTVKAGLVHSLTDKMRENGMLDLEQQPDDQNQANAATVKPTKPAGRVGPRTHLTREELIERMNPARRQLELRRLRLKHKIGMAALNDKDQPES